jgi:hypothetical protein
MTNIYSTGGPQFYKATIRNWYHFLKEYKFKNIIIKSFQFCLKENYDKLYFFVIISNGMHLVWQS